MSQPPPNPLPPYGQPRYYGAPQPPGSPSRLPVAMPHAAAGYGAAAAAGASYPYAVPMSPSQAQVAAQVAAQQHAIAAAQQQHAMSNTSSTVAASASAAAVSSPGPSPAKASSIASSGSPKKKSPAKSKKGNSNKEETEEEREMRLAKRRERDRKNRERKKADAEASEAGDGDTKSAASASKASTKKEKKKVTPKKKAASKKGSGGGASKPAKAAAGGKKKKPIKTLGQEAPLKCADGEDGGENPSVGNKADAETADAKAESHVTAGGVTVTKTTVPAPELGPGWKVLTTERVDTKAKVRKDKSWFNEHDRHFKTMPEIRRYKEALEEAEGDDEEAWAVIREMRRLKKRAATGKTEDDATSVSIPRSSKKAKKTPTKKAPSSANKSKGSTFAKKRSSDDLEGDTAKVKDEITPTKTPNARPKSSASKASASKSGKKTYVELSHDAIKALKDRSGSSVPAIAKWIQAEYPSHAKMDRKLVEKHARKALTSKAGNERFIKVKGSFKLNQDWVKKEAAKRRAKEADQRKRERERKKAAEKKRKLEDAKNAKERAEQEKIRKAEAERLRKERAVEEERQRIANMTPEERAKHERKIAEKEERKRQKEEEERRKKEIADRIKKRRFPMDDFKLIAEDKEFGLKYPPEAVSKRPYTPFVMTAVVPHDERGGRTPQALREASTWNPSHAEGSRGLISDMMQVFHFFNGDVGYSRMHPDKVPPFTLTNLFYAADEIIKGNSKVARALPPLISHLFVTCLRTLLNVVDEETGRFGDERGEEAEFTPQEARLRSDLKGLGDGLNVISWPAICLFYMDAMERFFTTEASSNDEMIPGLKADPIIFLPEDWDDSRCEEYAANIPEEEEGGALPSDYPGYLNGSGLWGAFDKISRMDPWNLSAEDVFALLRALTDDILSNDPTVASDMSDRGNDLYELRKAKRFADIHYKRVKNAIDAKDKKEAEEARKREKAQKDAAEGGENKVKESPDSIATDNCSRSPKSGAVGGDAAKDEGSEKKNEKGEEKKSKAGAKKWAAPKATKRELAAAEKAAIKANDAYEKGIKKLATRTDPIGYDKNLNPLYFFYHDPDRLYLEISKPAPTSYDLDLSFTQPNKSWHMIDSKSLFDEYLQSLDTRGKREHDLNDDMTGGSAVVRRYLFDDLAKDRERQARMRELENTRQRLENARNKCNAEESRRSGRLASNSAVELSKVEAEMASAQAAVDGAGEEVEFDYRDLTGLSLLIDFERGLKRKTKALSRLGASDDNGQTLQEVDFCSNLWSGGRGQGALGLIVDSMLDVEGHCERLVPWDRTDVTRGDWIGALKEIVCAWKRGNYLLLGPNNDDARELISSHPSSSQLVAQLKKPLLDLEERVFTITGEAQSQMDVEEADQYASAHKAEDDEGQEDAAKEREELDSAWKKKINRLANIPTKKTSLIRDIIIASISIARKAHMHDVLNDLRDALMLHRPMAAGAAKQKALEVLVKYGGYYGDDEESDDEDDMDIDVDGAQEGIEEKVETLLCGEANTIFASVKDDDEADRVEWINGVKNCKTVSMFAALTEAFYLKGGNMLSEMEESKESLDEALKWWDSHAGKKRGASKKIAKYDSSTGIWTRSELTQTFVWAKVVGHPWWPARVCIAKEKDIAQRLARVGRELVSYIGVNDVAAVDKEFEVKPFLGEDAAMMDGLDGESYSEDAIKQRNSALLIAKRILKSRDLIKQTPMKKTRPRIAFTDEDEDGDDEKKMG